MNPRSAGLRSGALVSGRRIEPGRRPALQSRGSWPVSRSNWNRGLSMNPKLVGSTPELNLSLSAARGRDIVLRCPRRPAQGRRNAAKFRNAYAALRFGDGPAVRPYQVLTLPPMNRETPTVQSERGLSQTAARILARALNLPRDAAGWSAASWDNSRSCAQAGSSPVSRSEKNNELSRKSPPADGKQPAVPIHRRLAQLPACGEGPARKPRPQPL